MKLALTGLVLIGLAWGCQAHSPARVDVEILAVMVTVGPVEPDREDELLAYSPTRYLTEQAGQGVEGDMDLSAACGCAETGSSSPSAPTGPNVTPVVDHKKKATLKVLIHIPR